jgi:hypothetical protein
MRAGAASRIEPVIAGPFEPSRSGWLQAGFVSFAYRLAHLRAPRPLVFAGLVLAFLMV